MIRNIFVLFGLCALVAENYVMAVDRGQGIASAGRKVFCLFTVDFESQSRRYVNACRVDKASIIDNEEFLFGSPKNTSIEKFSANGNKNVKFLPRNIGENLPNLEEFWVDTSGLTIIRDFYFKNMGKLKMFNLKANRITTIEANAFDDLTRVSRFWLDDNLIETLDEKLFAKMVNLGAINLTNNKIKFLSPTTFKIPGNEKLFKVDLKDNICISRWYYDDAISNQLESDLKAECSQ